MTELHDELLSRATSIDVSGMTTQEQIDLFVQRQAAIRNGEDPDDPEVAARYKPEAHRARRERLYNTSDPT